MKKRILPLVLAALLFSSGCSALLERSYSDVEPYTDRYWETGLEDTLKAESYQDLVNALLMLLEQRSEEGVIRFYAEEDMDVDQLVRTANGEVLEETMLGSYLLEDLQVTSQPGAVYCTLTYALTYREDTEDPEDMMVLSDSRSLVDLLRVAIREEHGKMGARFVSGVSCQAVTAAVESLWQEICLSAAMERPPARSLEEESPEDGEELQPRPQRQEKPIIYPPCPWLIRFYPGGEWADVVEVRFTGSVPQLWIQDLLADLQRGAVKIS